MAIWGTVCCSLFFCSKFCSSIPNGRCRGKFFNVACYVTYGRMACGTLSISEDGKVEKENLFWERYMSCTGGQMCYTDGTVIAVDLSRNGIDQG